MKTLNFLGRFMSITIMLCLFLSTQLSSQKGDIPEGPTNSISYPIKVDHHVSVFYDDCKNKIHSYVEFYFADSDQEVISKIVVRDKNNSSNQRVLTNGVWEAELFNVKPAAEGDKNPILIASIYGDKGKLITDYVINVKRADDGMIDVSSRLDNYLAQFSKTGGKGKGKGNFWFFFCDKLLSRVEIFAFFQEFLKLTEEESCEMIKTYAQVFGVQFDEDIKDTTYYKLLCNLFEIYLETIGSGDNSGGGEDDENEDSCVCNLIRTKSSAQSFHKNSGSSLTDECVDYDSYIKAEQLDSKKNDNDLSFSEGRQGAAKAAQLYLNYDGVDSSPDDFTISTSIGSSSLRFRSVCIDPVTVTANLDNCESCDKEVTINYGFFTEAQLFSATHACFGCAQKAKGVMEEFATVFVTNGDDDSDILYNEGKRYETECDWDNHDPSLQETISDAVTLTNTISAAVDTPSVNAIGEAVIELINFYENNIQESGCDELFFPQPLWSTGSNTYILKPGKSLLATITSGTTFGAKVVNHGEVLMRSNSDFYLTGVLKTIPNEDGEVPDYCDCELVGSYVVGSLDQDNPDIPVEDEDSGIDPKWDQLFLEAPLGLSTMRQFAGEIIGTSSEWQGAFETAGCCAVNLPCDSDCVFVRGCDEVVIGYGANIQEASMELLSELNEGNINIYPNPLHEGQALEIQMLNPEDVSTISIMSISGKLIQNMSINNNYNISLNTSGFKQGIYVVVINFIDGSKDFRRVSLIR